MNKSVKALIIFIISILILLLGATGVLFAYQGKEIPILEKIVTIPYIEQSPEEVINVMQQKMASLTTAHYELGTSIVWSAYGSPLSIQSRIVFDGGFREKFIGQLVVQNVIDLQGLNFLANIEIHSTSEKSYFKITELPAIPFMDLEKIKGKWYEYSPPSIKDSQADRLAEVQSLLLNSNLVYNINRLPDEIINKQRVYHYKVSLDKENFQKILIALVGNEKQSGVLLSDLNGKIQLELWIGKKDNYLYSIKGKVEDQKSPFDFTLNISEFNQIVAIEEPSNSYSLDYFTDELFNQTNFLDLPLFGYLVGINAKEFVDDADEDNLYTIWERMFGTDPTNPDTDQDGYLDGQEIRNNYDPKGAGKLFK